MARLKVTLRGAQISDVHLDPSREYLAGRKETCDILLQPERGISREHFRVKFADGGWVVQSMSRFGEIFSGGDRVEKVGLEHGLIFQVPPYEFQFRDLPEEEVRESSVQAQAVIGENDRTVVGVAQQVPFIKMMSSDGQIREMLRLESGEVWVAGRDPSCQIIIPDQRVSRKQYEIRKMNGAFTIIDLNSVNGTFLNGSPISSVDPHTLKSGDSLSVLDNIMYFELHDPNFKYKVDKIDVPPLAFSDKELNLNVEEFSGFTSSSVEQSQNDQPSQASQQQQQNSSPLMVQQVSESYAENAQAKYEQPRPNQQNQNSSQYYQFTPNQADMVPAESRWEKFKKNKPLLAATILIFLGGAFYVSEEISKDDQPPVSVQQPASKDPFTQLTPEQQKTVKDLLSLAQKAMLQNKYSFAIENLKKLHELLPIGYQDSKGMLEEATLNEQIISQKLEQERLDAERAQQQLEIQNTVAKCEKEMKPDITVEKMRECLAPASLIDAEHPEVTRLLSEAERIATEREIERQRIEKEKEKTKVVVVVEVDHLKKKYELAEKFQQSGKARRAIRAYNEVLNSEHKDLKDYKKKSQERIDFILKKIQEKVDSIAQQADVPLKDGKLREGIEILRQALDLDPSNEELSSRINMHVNELKNQVKVLYQESIIDENFGNLDGDDVRQGAKQKWKKILELDVDDGEYYRKAFTKLKRYGVF